jgi:hypothetical protein
VTSDAFWTIGTLVMEGRRLRVIKARAERAPAIKPRSPGRDESPDDRRPMIITGDPVR